MSNPQADHIYFRGGPKCRACTATVRFRSHRQHQRVKQVARRQGLSMEELFRRSLQERLEPPIEGEGSGI